MLCYLHTVARATSLASKPQIFPATFFTPVSLLIARFLLDAGGPLDTDLSFLAGSARLQLLLVTVVAAAAFSASRHL